MAQLIPNLRFNGAKCREAMQFYKHCLGGDLDFMTVKGSPMEAKMPPETHNLIMHSTLTNKKLTLMGSDMMRDKATVGDNVSLCLECESEKEIKDLFAKLSEGGKVFMPLEDQFWGALFGVLTDKYGVEWMLNWMKKK